MKTCTKCGLEKDFCDFPTRNGKYRSNCKVCAREMTNKHYQNNKKYYYDKNKKRKVDLKQHLLEYLSHKCCIDCGEKDPVVLDFDHRNFEEKQNSISEMILRYQKSWVTIQEEIDKCDVRCANCHRRRTAKQFNWYKHLNNEGV